jgi:3-oxoacyl-[acyl-carrier protein] reductase
MTVDNSNTLAAGLTFTVPEGATALITGGSRGIGRAVALRLAAVGYDIWLNYRHNDDLAREVRSEIQDGTGRRCRLLRFDVSDPEQVAAALLPLIEESAPHVLVNNAGIVCDGAMVLMPFEDWRRVIATTLDGFFLVTKYVLQGMIPRRSGRIVNISSTSGQAGLPGQTNYAAAKAGLIGATKALALEVARRSILVNAVAPGFIETDMTREAPIERMLKMVPLSRMGTVEEVAGAVAFLVSDEAAYITGQVIACNGGLHT